MRILEDGDLAQVDWSLPIARLRSAVEARLGVPTLPADRPAPGDCTTAGSAGFLPAAFKRSFTGVGTVSGVSVPTHVLTPKPMREAKNIAENSPIRSNRALHCSGDILSHGYVPRM